MDQSGIGKIKNNYKKESPVTKSKKDVVSKTWAYTLNNYNDQEIRNLSFWEVSKHRCAKEIASTGTKHLQGAVTFKAAKRYTTVVKLLTRAHWEVAKSMDPATYCAGQDSEIIVNIGLSGKKVSPVNVTDVTMVDDEKKQAIQELEEYLTLNILPEEQKVILKNAGVNTFVLKPYSC